MAREHQLSFRGREFRRRRAHPVFIALLAAAAFAWLLSTIPFPTFDGGRGRWAKEADAACLQLTSDLRRQNVSMSMATAGEPTDAELELVARSHLANHRRLLARLHGLSTPKGAPEDAVIIVEALTPVYAEAERRALAGNREGYEQTMQGASGLIQRAHFELQRAGAPTCADIV